jgi:tellurite resistance protein TehA-like permease
MKEKQIIRMFDASPISLDQAYMPPMITSTGPLGPVTLTLGCLARELAGQPTSLNSFILFSVGAIAVGVGVITATQRAMSKR